MTTEPLTEIAVRDADPAEYAAAIDVTLAAYAEYEPVLPPGAWEPYAASIRQAIGANTSSARIVALDGGEIVGSVLLEPPEELARTGRPPQPYPEVRLVATAPHARRRGVASALLEACIRRARAAGYTHIGLHSTRYMADAIRLYERRGFVRSTDQDFTTPAGVHVMGFRLDLGVA